MAVVAVAETAVVDVRECAIAAGQERPWSSAWRWRWVEPAPGGRSLSAVAGHA